MEKEIADLYVFKSDSSKALYQTLQYVDGTLSCDCKGWTFKRRGTPDGERTCKHTRIIQAGMGDVLATRHVHYANVTVNVRVEVSQEIPTGSRKPTRVFED